MRLAEC